MNCTLSFIKKSKMDGIVETFVHPSTCKTSLTVRQLTREFMPLKQKKAVKRHERNKSKQFNLFRILKDITYLQEPRKTVTYKYLLCPFIQPIFK